ncbi:MAG: tetratricopeptide repeat protein [Anaerolineae bacterium]|nr:tetratricopeptide repeat protein [Anaerolineae bacterium]
MSQPTRAAPPPSSPRTPSRRAKGLRLTITERHYERGLYHYTRKKYDLALTDLDNALERDPRNPEYYTARGLVLLQGGYEDEAEEDFAYGLKLDPTQWLAHYGRGLRAFKAKQYQAAIDHFSRAQHIAPTRAEVYYHRAVAFYEMGNLAQAHMDMEFAVQQFENHRKRRSQAKKWLKILGESQPG